MSYPYIGIDIGKTAIHVCHPAEGLPARAWPVTVLQFAVNLDWHEQLTRIIAPDAIVCFEPTGYHLSAPIMNVIRTYRPEAEIWLIGHSVSGQIRQAEISAAKTDEMDARALTVAAYKIAHGQAPRNVRRYDPMLDETVQALRSLVNNHRRVTKTTTRLTNRLHAYVHSIHPLLDIKYSTWLGWANSHGLIDPADIHSFLASEEARTMDGRRLVHLQKLAQYLPFITASTASYNEIMRTIGQLATAEAEVKSLAADIEQMVTAPPFAEVTRRLLTIPTANATEIATFHVAAHGLLDQLTPDEFKACIGIAARSNTSGSIDRTRAQKGGYTPAKDALWMLATRLMHPNQRPNSLYTYHERLKARPDKNKEFRATRAKLAQIISGVARSPEGYKS